MKRKTNFKKGIKFLLGIAATTAITISCTDLEIDPDDSLFPDADSLLFQGVSDPDSFIDGLYGGVSRVGDQAGLFALNEVTTDAALIPTRGTDWGDNGIWRQLHQHDWRPNHPFVESVWTDWNSTHFGAAQVLSELTETTAEQRADAHFLRAMGMWVILDIYGQVPVRNVEESLSVDPFVLTGSEAVDQIMFDLNAAIDDLPAGGPSNDNQRPTKAAARMFLAKVLLNRHIYESRAADNTDMAQVISLIDEVSAEGYGLQSGFFDLFEATEDIETVWWIPTGVGNRIWNGLHYNQTSERDNPGGGWNGFSTLASYYDLFEGDSEINIAGSGQEERRGEVPTGGLPVGSVPGATDNNGDGIADGSHIGVGFLIGQQYASDGSPLTDRGGALLTFKRDFLDGNGDPNIVNNDETTGIRVTKYRTSSGSFNAHEIFFRYSDAHLMKAEALFRSGSDATAMINELRIIRGATPIGSVTEQDIIDERGRELYAELWRRNDLIRFGQYTNDWEFKLNSSIGDDTKSLFPIPASQVILNPNLTQNPGY